LQLVNKIRLNIVAIFVVFKAPVQLVRISTHLRKPEGTSLEPSPALIHLVEGRPATLRCTAVGGYPPPRMQLLVDERVEPASPATTMSTSSSAALRGGGGQGLRVVTVTSWRWTVDYRARPSDDGAQLKCLATVPSLTAAVATVLLSVDCKCDFNAHQLPHVI